MSTWTFAKRVIFPAALSIATIVLLASPPALAQGHRGPGGGQGGSGGQGGGETTLGNNLSVPAVFAEGIGVTGLPVSGTGADTGLRPRPEESCYSTNFSYTTPCFVPGTEILSGGISYYPQQTASAWQAQWVDASTLGKQDVVVNWSDNLTKQYWTPNSKIRVETVLYQTPADTLTAYKMALLSGTKRTELWGTDTTTFASTYRTVFSPNAHLIIQKITGPGGTAEGTACVDATVYDSFGVDGPGGYGAEVNVSGNLIYGYNWTIKNCGGTLLGWWRLTFKIDPQATIGTATVASNTVLSAIDPGDETGVTFMPTVNSALNESILEIEIKQTRQGGGKKGGGE